MTADTLGVPGARLSYEVRGSGPVLLLVPGGGADRDFFGSLPGLLADRYTVVTYDPRGISRSRLEEPVPDERFVEVYADDARRLLGAVGGTEPAYVVGSSGGAIIGLELVARHPELVRTLVAHEPPVVELLPDRERRRAETREVYETYRSEGPGPAMQMFLGFAGIEMRPQAGGQASEGEPSPELREAMDRMRANVEFFLGHYLRPFTHYLPDVAALKAAPTRVIVGVGNESRGQLAHRTGVALAELLATEPVVFPGDHGGFAPHAAAFAELLDGLLRGGVPATPS